nr:MAG TPA: hypothetical protein [Caudoviricetes sp.]
MQIHFPPPFGMGGEQNACLLACLRKFIGWQAGTTFPPPLNARLHYLK